MKSAMEQGSQSFDSEYYPYGRHTPKISVLQASKGYLNSSYKNNIQYLFRAICTIVQDSHIEELFNKAGYKKSLDDWTKSEYVIEGLAWLDSKYRLTNMDASLKKYCIEYGREADRIAVHSSSYGEEESYWGC